VMRKLPNVFNDCAVPIEAGTALHIGKRRA
jgi:hypothetical protein